MAGIGAGKVFLAGVDQLDRTAALHRQRRRQDLGLAGQADPHAKAAAHIRGVAYRDLADGQVQGFGEDHFGGIRGLGGGDHVQSAVGTIGSHGAVGLHLRLLDPGQLHPILHHLVAVLERLVGIAAKGEDDRTAADVVVFRIGKPGLDLRGVGLDGLQRVVDGRQLLPLDPDELYRLGGDLLRIRGHAGHFVADVLGFAGKDGLIQHRLMGQRSDEHGGRAVPQLGGGIFKGAHRAHAGQGLGRAGVDGEDLRMGVGAAEDLAMEHPGQMYVKRKHAPAGHLVKTVVAGDVFSHVSHAQPSPLLMRSAAASTACSMFT